MLSTPRTVKASSIATSNPPTSSSLKRGRAKILDFGLAKVAPALTSSSQMAAINTQTRWAAKVARRDLDPDMLQVDQFNRQILPRKPEPSLYPVLSGVSRSAN